MSTTFPNLSQFVENLLAEGPGGGWWDLIHRSRLSIL
jgi:hypothetical protein